MPSTITWLHLSDLHLCGPKTGWETDRVLNLLREDLQRMAANHGLAPDLVLVTGDLAFGQLGEGDLSIQSQFEDAALFLEEVRAAFRAPIPAERVFLVPGNHDVDRRRIRESQTDWLDNLANKPDPAKAVDEMLRDATGEWPGLMERLETYRQFLQQHYPHLLPDEDAEKRLCYAHTLDIHGHRLGIAGLNSAWSCGRGKDKGPEQGRLWLGGGWQLSTLGGQLQNAGAEIELALAHHPLDWLMAKEKLALNPRLENDFHFFLHGHEHQGWVDKKPRHIRLAAGACYGKTPAESGYSLVRLDPDAGTGQVWLRRLDETGLGWIPRAVPGHTDNHGLWPLSLEWLAPKQQAAGTATPAARVDKAVRPHPPDFRPDSISPDNRPRQPEADEPHSGGCAPEALVHPTGSPPPATPMDTPAPGSPEARGVYGRGRAIEKLAGQLGKKPILLVHGIAGIGKSLLIREVCRDLTLPSPSGASPLSLQYVPITVTAHTDATELFGNLAPSLGCHDQDPAPPRDFMRRIDAEALKQYARAEPRVIHVHRAQELFGSGQFHDREMEDLLRALATALPHWRFVLESTKAFPAGLLPERLCTIKELRGLHSAAVRAYFRHPFGPQDPRGWALEPKEAEALYQRLGGENRETGAHPLGMALLASVADGLKKTPPAVVAHYPLEFYRSLEERLFNDLYRNVLAPAQQHLLRLAALYRQPIPDEHVEALQQRVGDQNAFRALLQRFLLSPDPEESHYTLHTLFAELAAKRLDSSGFDVQVDHRVVADAWLAGVGTGNWRSLRRVRAANEAAFHLLEAEEFHRLRELSESLLGWDTPFKLEAWSARLHERNDMENGRYVRELLVKLDPDNHKAHRFLGETIERLDGRGTDQALTHYRRAFELNPSFPPYLANLGRCLLQRREYGRFVALVDGLDDYNRARAVNAFVDDIYSQCLQRMGEGEAASKIRQEQIRQGTRNPALYNDEADYLGKQQRYTQALAVLDKAERAGVMDEHLWAVKAGILQAAGQGEAASQLRQGRIAAGIRNAVFYNDEALYQWQQRDDPNTALAVLEQAAAAGCANDHILAVKARLLEARGDGEAAAKLRRERIEAGSRNPAFYNDQALSLRDRGEYEAALAVLDRAKNNRCADEATHNIRRSIEQRRRA
uniref:Calcineurin-like phosphoesterase n=1 Tax=Candidatus Kentrum sp. FM TaxID=2126340 RepID=A0A450TF13_9GAMM|nr:MAG: Calcineurin-like phosphoesterase [Candidatus Kentron sp. FM]VFJ65650.1 MAG: Calcineurin-like phosphoesterase [Candidatus Kentron sp. FM]VFK15819.1 MAG: Calcineurin-like phosphoesterase [Candidatus Kentron sp. FM]